MVLTRFELEVHCSAVVAEELLTLLALARWCLLITDFTLRIIHVVNYAVQPRFIVYKKRLSVNTNMSIGIVSTPNEYI